MVADLQKKEEKNKKGLEYLNKVLGKVAEWLKALVC